MIPRETLYSTIFDGFLVPLLAPGATVGGPTKNQTPGTPTSDQPFNIVSRETIEVQRVAPLLQPVLFMDEAIEELADSGPGLTHVKSTVYFHIGVTSQPGTAVASLLNPLIDTLMGAFKQDTFDNLGLGDLVERAQFSGMMVKNLGQNSTDASARQAVAYIPFEIVFA